jgi:hypothetical protein
MRDYRKLVYGASVCQSLGAEATAPSTPDHTDEESAREQRALRAIDEFLKHFR